MGTAVTVHFDMVKDAKISAGENAHGGKNMKDYVVYHNPDSMGVPVTGVNSLAIVTDKKVADVIGDRVWLLTGEGSPRAFSLRSYFIVDHVESGAGARFETRLSGTVGKVFDPMVAVGSEDWFADFKRSQGNFAFGFQAITERRFINGLEAAAGCAEGDLR
jgi:hypothetical protein